VVFSARGKSADVTRTIEHALSETFNYPGTVMLRSKRQLGDVVSAAPVGFGDAPSAYRYDVIFLQRGLTARTALSSVDRHPEVDTVCPGPSVLYFTRLISKASKSRLSKLVSNPIYRQMTIRNWKTTQKLLEMTSTKPG
jgi:uncharacterized protein (DUF1697 family)